MNGLIYMMTHCAFTPPDDLVYHPLQVGRALHPSLGFDTDNTGDNISSRNSSYCELTGVYWVWKNSPIPPDGFIGISHYRRCLLDEHEHLWNSPSISNALKKYDIMTTKQVTLDCSYHTGFGGRHNTADLDAAGNALRALYPDYYPDYEKLVNENRTYFGNMMIARRSLYNDYCTWLFSILFETEKHVDVTGYDGYAKRLYGFLSEFLLFVWVSHNRLRVNECNVAVIGSKTETSSVCDEMISCLDRHDTDGAMKCLMSEMKLRPDILMEASDIGGTLKLLMEITSSCAGESSSDIHMLDDIPDAKTLIPIFRKLNVLTSAVVAQTRKGLYNIDRSPAFKAYSNFTAGCRISHSAQAVSLRMFCDNDREYDDISNILFRN